MRVVLAMVMVPLFRRSFLMLFFVPFAIEMYFRCPKQVDVLRRLHCQKFFILCRLEKIPGPGLNARPVIYEKIRLFEHHHVSRRGLPRVGLGPGRYHHGAGDQIAADPFYKVIHRIDGGHDLDLPFRIFSESFPASTEDPGCPRKKRGRKHGRQETAAPRRHVFTFLHVLFRF